MSWRGSVVRGSLSLFLVHAGGEPSRFQTGVCTISVWHLLPQGAPGVVSKVSVGAAKLELVTCVQWEEVPSSVGRRGEEWVVGLGPRAWDNLGMRLSGCRSLMRKGSRAFKLRLTQALDLRSHQE